jgi:Transmembrane family 220, helix
LDFFHDDIVIPCAPDIMQIPRPLTVCLNLLAAGLFATFAWYQRNDLDPAIYDQPSMLDAALWLLFYAGIALAFGLVIWRPVPRWLLILGVIACLIEMGRSGPGLYENLFGEREFTITQTSMSAADPRVELTREFGGALMALMGVGLIALQSRRKEVSTRTAG